MDPLDAVLAIIARHEPDAGAVYSRKETSSPDASVAGDRGCKSRQEQTTNSEKPKLDPLLKTAIAIYVPALALYFLAAAGILAPHADLLSAFLLTAWLLSGLKVMKNAIRKCRGNPFSEEMLMSIASLRAVAC